VEDDGLVGAEAGAGGDAEQEGVADLAGSAGDGDTNGSLHRIRLLVFCWRREKGVFTHQEYQHFSLQYMTQIVQGLNRQYEGRIIPVTLFTKGGGQWLEAIAASGCDAIGLDWTTDMTAARQRVGDKVALQGNMDPAVLYGDDALVSSKVQEILSQYGHGSGHVFNLGHGITPDIEPERVKTFVDAVHQFSVPYHQS
jgi:uroporphyrinogen decarboxylase